jgi:DNA-binding GntR family transcriptional regulator
VPQPRATRTEETYQYLVDEVLRGRWQVGDIVSTNALAEELGLSRTPVLQALKRLESEGLVEIIPQVGCRILAATGGALADLFATRAALEGVAASVAALRLDADELATLEVTLRRLDEAAAEGDLAEYARRNERFHMLVDEGARMPRLAQAARTLWAQMRPQLARLPRVEAQLGPSQAEHRELYEALRQRAPRRARSAAERHARLSAARFSVELEPRTADQLVHQALIYGRDEEFLAVTVPLLQDGLDAGEQVLAVTTARNAALLARALGRRADDVEFRDANDWYLLPSHTLLSYARYAEQAVTPRVRIIGEVAWSGESLAPVSEWIRYESALNVAFADQPATIVCPYDLRELPEEILGGARRTHPELYDGATTVPSAQYVETSELVRELDREGFPPPTARTSDLPIERDLRDVRAFVLRHAKRAGVSGKRLQDVFLAVQEVASAVIAQGAERGGISAWIADGMLVFEVRDGAAGVGNPLVGQLSSDPAMVLEPRGLWLARLLCDLVEVRSGDRGLVVRLHVALH